MSIARFGLLAETQQRRLVNRLGIWCSVKAFNEFNLSVSKLFNPKEIEEALERDFKRVMYANKVTMIDAILTAAIHDLSPVEDYYRENYGIEFKGDYKLIISDLKKYIQMVKAPVIKNTKEQKFEELVAGVEKILGYNIPRDTKLYQFKYQYEFALKQIEAQSNNNG